MKNKIALIARHYNDLKSAREAAKNDEVIIKNDKSWLVVKKYIWDKVENETSL